jgi:hypothetical protein
MTPESQESRLGRLEQAHARLDQRVDGLTRQVGELVPLTTGQVRLEGVVNGLKDDVSEVGEKVGDLRRVLEDRDKQQTEERRSLRLALVGLAGTILAALIAAAVTIVASGAHP